MAAGARTQLVSGPDAAAVLNELKYALQDRRDNWPYVHIYPPPQSDDVHFIATVPIPPVPPGAFQTTVLTYQVQRGRRFYLKGILFQADVAFAVSAGTWTILRNRTGTQFKPEQGLFNVPVLLGSTAFEPWPLQRTREFEPLDIVSIQFNNATLGSGNLIGGIFGWTVPAVTVEKRRYGR